MVLHKKKLFKNVTMYIVQYTGPKKLVRNNMVLYTVPQQNRFIFLGSKETHQTLR